MEERTHALEMQGAHLWIATGPWSESSLGETVALGLSVLVFIPEFPPPALGILYALTPEFRV